MYFTAVGSAMASLMKLMPVGSPTSPRRILTVSYTHLQGCYIILDLHWSDCNAWGRNIGQHSMPDLYSLTFWNDCATAYANNPAVIFDLYNEPHDVPWDVWLKGGNITDKPNGRGQVAQNYQCVGMQAVLDLSLIHI